MSDKSFVGKVHSFTVTTKDGKVINLGEGNLFQVDTGNLRFQEAVERGLDPALEVKIPREGHRLNFGRSFPGFFNSPMFDKVVRRQSPEWVMVEMDFSLIEERIRTVMESAPLQEPYSLRHFIKVPTNKPEKKIKERRTPLKHYEGLNTKKKKGCW